LNCLRALHFAKKPVFIVGAGAPKAESTEFANLLGLPILPTFGARDYFPASEPLLVGAFGTHGTIEGNRAVQNADWILSVGSRLDTKATGPIELFAPKAKLYMVDIDPAEIRKFGNRVEGRCQDATRFLKEAIERVHAVRDHEGHFPDFLDWQLACSQRPTITRHPYEIIDQLSDLLEEDEVICSDTGCALIWMMQRFSFKRGQRFIHAWNQTPMGYGLPAAIGAHYATGRRVVLITGDGSLQMSIGELATVERHDLPIKIVLFNNRGHAMCRQTQRQWLGGEYPATSYEGGLACPDFDAIAKAYGFTVYGNSAVRFSTEPWGRWLYTKERAFVNLDIHPDAKVVPQVRYGKALDDPEPWD
jgi:acetolactate synthase-1/2/3 large subunit